MFVLSIVFEFSKLWDSISAESAKRHFGLMVKLSFLQTFVDCFGNDGLKATIKTGWIYLRLLLLLRL